MKVNHFFFTILLCLLFFTSNCFTQTAGPPFNFYFQDTTFPVDETGCMDVIVENFTDVSSFEFAFSFDDTKFEFQNLESTEVSLSNIDAAISPSSNEAIVTVVFFDFFGSSSFLDSTILFSVCFQAIGELGDTSLIEISDLLPNGNPSQLFNVADKFLIPDFNLVPASLTIGDPLNTNVNNLRLLDDLNSYPNPAQDKLYLETVDQNWNYQILNLQGQQMMQGEYQDYIGVEALPSGIYFLQLQQEDDLYQAIKFIKQ